MSATYSVNNINYNRVYIAVIISVIAHVIIITILLNKEHTAIYMDSGIQANDKPRISLSINKMQPVKKILPKTEVIKPLPVIPPIEKITKVVVDKVIEEKSIEEFAEDQKEQQQIPIIENPTFLGKRTPPIYPKRALMLKQEGIVLLKALIGINGDINDIQMIASSGYSILDKSAIDAVRKWKFKPAYMNGKPSLSWAKVPVEFVIR